MTTKLEACTVAEADRSGRFPAGQDFLEHGRPSTCGEALLGKCEYGGRVDFHVSHHGLQRSGHRTETELTVSKQDHFTRFTRCYYFVKYFHTSLSSPILHPFSRSTASESIFNDHPKPQGSVPSFSSSSRTPLLSSIPSYDTSALSHPHPHHSCSRPSCSDTL